jgi:hypothetical protein
LKRRLRRVRLHQNILLEHNNAKPHTSRPATEATEKLDWISPLNTPAMQSRLAPRDFHLFPKTNEDLRGHLCDSNEDVESILRSQTKKQSVRSRGAVNTGDKRIHVKNYFRVSFIKLSLLKQQ